MSLIGKIQQLNDADLSKLSSRLALIRAEMEKNIKPTVVAVGAPSSSASGLTPAALIQALSEAKKAVL